MANTINAEMVALSNHVYKDWMEKTYLVKTCDNSFEGELDLKTREIDIPVFHDISIHLTTIKERELQPAKPEVIRSSTKRVMIDKGRYSHWMDLTINELVQKLSQENSEMRKKLTNKWAKEADTELATWIAKLPVAQQIDFTSGVLGTDNLLTKDTVFLFLDRLNAHAEINNYEAEDFTLYGSSKMEQIFRDANILLGSNLDAQGAFEKGKVQRINNINYSRIAIEKVVARNTTSKAIEAEWGIWKTRDGIQYVVPYKTTTTYEITPDKVLLGGHGYQMVEYYDFFNLYPGRLQKLKVAYAHSSGTTPQVPPSL